MSTFDTPPVTCILCELANVSPAKILVAGVVFGQAFGVAGVMDKLCAPHQLAAHAAVGTFKKAIDVEDHRRGKVTS